MHMLTDRVEVRPDDWVLAIGAASGVGSAAIQIAKQKGARVITTGSTEEKRQFGLGLGADYAVDSTDENWPKEIRSLTEKRGVNLVVEHVGADVLEKVFHCLARGGTVVTCGATAGRNVSFEVWPFFVKQHRLIGSYGRNHSAVTATLQWAAEGRLRGLPAARARALGGGLRRGTGERSWGARDARERLRVRRELLQNRLQP